MEPSTGAEAADREPAHAGPWRRLAVAARVCAALLATGNAARAQPGDIYSCTDAAGKRLTSDHLIAECVAREQRILNPDGSVRRILPPTLTADERQAQDARERKSATDRAAVQDAARRDRTLLLRYPDEAAHAAARRAALDDVRKAMASSEQRMAALAAERKPLVAEAEFYVRRALPSQLKQQLDANDAATDAQRTLSQNQQAELGRVNGVYDVQLARLRQLWGGAAPGSLGPLPTSAVPESERRH